MSLSAKDGGHGAAQACQPRGEMLPHHDRQRLSLTQAEPDSRRALLLLAPDGSGQYPERRAGVDHRGAAAKVHHGALGIRQHHHLGVIAQVQIEAIDFGGRHLPHFVDPFTALLQLCVREHVRIGNPIRIQSVINDAAHPGSTQSGVQRRNGDRSASFQRRHDSMRVTVLHHC
ncbi:hypothetical protein X805_27340 [Sphaerotilus natans subsp. natans DSM 6575]|uniref:Uncharacterized protein n=1 Tax=Sphaerotilus natans subsp. natans DSM 6575 TaxID=1286631 RepID=A0A059KJR4_9BURK|nr:hypothetical protein X805_27340 [Sphaerotilus natans subsp. natans DSM 6575]